MLTMWSIRCFHGYCTFIYDRKSGLPIVKTYIHPSSVIMNNILKYAMLYFLQIEEMGVLSVRQWTVECVPFDFYCIEEKN